MFHIGTLYRRFPDVIQCKLKNRKPSPLVLPHVQTHMHSLKMRVTQNYSYTFLRIQGLCLFPCNFPSVYICKPTSSERPGALYFLLTLCGT